MSTPDWRIYERFVWQQVSETVDDEFTVIPNATLVGSISGVKRQIDVLVDARWDEHVLRRVIIEAKRYKVKVDVKDIETFEGMMKDCRAQHGILVCPHGYTPAALRRAQDAITIKLVPLAELENFDLRAWDICIGRCRTAKRKSTGLVLWDNPYGLAIGNSPLSIMTVGKCDVCRSFHVWCWDCGQKFALRDADEYKCSCARFWLTAVEDEAEEPDGSVTQGIYLYLCLLTGTIIPVDRRRLR